MKTIASIKELIREYVAALPVAEAANGILASINDTIGTNWYLKRNLSVPLSIEINGRDNGIKLFGDVADDARDATAYVAFWLSDCKDGRIALDIDPSEFLDLGLPSGGTNIPRGRAVIDPRDNSVEFEENYAYLEEESAEKRDRVIKGVKFPFNKWFYECAQRTHLIMPETHGMKPSFEAISALLEGGDRAPFENWRRENEESCKRSYTSFSVTVDTDRVTITQGDDNEMTVYRTRSGDLEISITINNGCGWGCAVALLKEAHFSNQHGGVYYRCKVGDWRQVDDSFIDEYLLEAINEELYRIQRGATMYDDSIDAWEAHGAILLGTYDKECVYGFVGKNALSKLRELPEGASILDEIWQ
ncbi:hypothetical protein [Paenibacillus thiaminolyticus]|uniref:hypothetical protein n=1 Tax=Paenibacillus thiaminolyticus TaxID=49283 RepID=UPI00254298FD|nr:hypothetical protein [Paenibacillus thiaminolyticus]WII36804.1 hypothetical protein O0V01_24735 [Paenibacillus thiaminolyticus]